MRRRLSLPRPSRSRVMRISTTKELFELTAADLMSREVVTIPRKMSLHGAAHRLAQAQVSGAPVIDEQGRCIGMLSATDLARWMDRGQPTSRPRASEFAD